MAGVYKKCDKTKQMMKIYAKDNKFDVFQNTKMQQKSKNELTSGMCKRKILLDTLSHNRRKKI